MNNRLIPLSPTAHRHHGWMSPPDCRFAATDTVAPLLLAELPAAVAAFPLAIVRPPDGRAQLVAVMGLHAGQNLLVDPQGRWLAAYRPACHRAWPFSLQSAPGDAQRLMLCFNEGSGLLRAAPDPARGEARFFDDQGKMLPHLQKTLEFLETCAGNTQLTLGAVAALEAAGLLQPWPGFTGLLRIDEAALARLNAGQLLALRDAHALSLAYALLLSLPRMAVLQRLLAQQQAVQPASAAALAATPDLGLAEKLFDSGQSDTLKFNW